MKINEIIVNIIDFIIKVLAVILGASPAIVSSIFWVKTNNTIISLLIFSPILFTMLLGLYVICKIDEWSNKKCNEVLEYE